MTKPHPQTKQPTSALHLGDDLDDFSFAKGSNLSDDSEVDITLTQQDTEGFTALSFDYLDVSYVCLLLSIESPHDDDDLFPFSTGMNTKARKKRERHKQKRIERLKAELKQQKNFDIVLHSVSYLFFPNQYKTTLVFVSSQIKLPISMMKSFSTVWIRLIQIAIF